MNSSLKIAKNRLLYLTLMFAVLLLTIIMIVSSKEHVQNDFLIVATFVINITFFMFNFLISIEKHAFSLNMMFWLFNLFFFGAAPLLQYLTNTYAWGLSPTGNEVLYANFLISIWAFVYIIGKKLVIPRLSWKNKLSPVVKEKRNDQNIECDYYFNNNMLMILLIISVLITAYNIIFIGIEDLLFRSTNTGEGQSQIMFLITVNVFKNIQLFTAVLFILKAKRSKRINLSTIIAVLSLLISCFPTGLSRYMAASFYAGLLIILVDSTRSKRWYSLFVLFGLVLAFPALNIFRYSFDMSNTDLMHMLKISFENAYLEGHFDAHQMIISIHRYTRQIGYEYFGQIIGALLFFIPRSVWPGKPIGTGHTVISSLDQYDFTNVSAPLMGEFYIAFGLVGIICGAIFVSKLLKKIDDKYWSEKNPLSTIRIIYPFSIFMFFFLSRGDMLSSWAYLCAQAVVGYVMCRLAIKRVYTRKEQ